MAGSRGQNKSNRIVLWLMGRLHGGGRSRSRDRRNTRRVLRNNVGNSGIGGIPLGLLTKLIIIDSHALEAFVLNKSQPQQTKNDENCTRLVLETLSAKIRPPIQKSTNHQGNAPKHYPPAIFVQLVGEAPSKTGAAHNVSGNITNYKKPARTRCKLRIGPNTAPNKAQQTQTKP